MAGDSPSKSEALGSSTGKIPHSATQSQTQEAGMTWDSSHRPSNCSPCAPIIYRLLWELGVERQREVLTLYFCLVDCLSPALAIFLCCSHCSLPCSWRRSSTNSFEWVNGWNTRGSITSRYQAISSFLSSLIHRRHDVLSTTQWPIWSSF